MAIKVGHLVGGRASGEVAFATGKGQRAERDLRVAQANAREKRRLRLAENARKEALAQRNRELALSRQDAERNRQLTLQRDVFQRAGRVDDRAFDRETGSLAAREREERTAREFALAAKHKADGDERQYTVEQKRKKDGINSSRAKIAEGLANGTYTEFQAQQFNQEFDRLELGISKMWGPKQVTPQDELRQRTFTADNGTLMYIDGAGKVQAYPGQLTPQEKLKATEDQKTQEYEWEQDRIEAEFKVQSKKADMVATLMDKNELTFEEASTTVDKMFAAPRTPEERQIVSQLQSIGMTDEVIEKAVQQEGSLQAVLERLQLEEEAQAFRDSEQVDAEITKDEFLNLNKKASTGSTGGVDSRFRSLSGFGGAGGGRF